MLKLPTLQTMVGVPFRLHAVEQREYGRFVVAVLTISRLAGDMPEERARCDDAELLDAVHQLDEGQRERSIYVVERLLGRGAHYRIRATPATTSAEGLSDAPAEAIWVRKHVEAEARARLRDHVPAALVPVRQAQS
jgi:hypothetical protein